jgi:YVTN family beta-propeller protein
VEVGKKPCSGLTEGFGSIWVPNCGDKTLSRVDEKTNAVTATLPIGPAESEGGIAASDDAVWLVTVPDGKLSRIDPKTNTVVAQVEVPAGSAAVVYGDGAVWVTTPKANMLTRVDAKTNKVTDSIETGPGPRFVTFGGGAVWTLNQGNGTVSRVDTKTRKVVANIEVGIPGTGGEIAYGFGHVWATVFQIPISEIDPATNTVIRQWTGNGGDSLDVALPDPLPAGLTPAVGATIDRITHSASFGFMVMDRNAAPATGWTFKAYSAAGKLMATCVQSGKALSCDKTGFLTP